MSGLTYCRIDLLKTHYQRAENAVLYVYPPVDKLKEIYIKYCEHKKFTSVMPLFDATFTDKSIDVWGYLDKNRNLVAFSLVKKHDSTNAESLQFAWDYVDAELKLGYASLEHECTVYKSLGYKYLYLGEASSYKSKLQGYEVLCSLQDTTASK